VGSVCKGGAPFARVARPLAMTKDAHTRAARRWGVMSTPYVGLTHWVAVTVWSISRPFVRPQIHVFVTWARRGMLIGLSGENRGTVIWEIEYKDLDLPPSCRCWYRSYWGAYSKRAEGVVRSHIRPVPCD